MRLLWIVGCAAAISAARPQPAAVQAAPPLPPGVAAPTSAAAAAEPVPALAPPGMAPVQTASGSTSDVDSYRWQIAVADAASVALLLSSTHGYSTVGAWACLLGGPAIHLANHEGGRAGASLGLRFGLPALGALSGIAIASANANHGCSRDDQGRCDLFDRQLVGAVLGAGLGMLGAMIIDTTLLARPRVRHPPRAAVSWAPGVSFTSQRAGLGVLGRF